LALTPGTRLGVYEVIARIGEGGMGQVYRATDTTLGRQVAIKILPDAFAADPERLARFEREAKTLASLNHPHIAAIYGFEKSGAYALVMELVEGEDLSQRIARGAIPLDEALPIARQIAEALEAAHEQGIVHRDLKPANIKVRPDGEVKVLDFGLAKAMEPTSVTDAHAMNSPTLSIHTTQAGIILGTAAYMSPEQARGQAVDKRADIWAFGVVLYEMVTGTRLFNAATMSDSLVAILTREPDLTVASEKTRRLLQRCLEKDPKKRLRDIGDAMALLETTPLDTAGKAERARPRAAGVALVLTAVGSLAFAALSLWTRPTAVQKTAARLTIPLPPGQEITSYPAITRDGRTVAYVTQQGSEDSQLYLRDLNSFEARLVPGSSGARQPFFSPDGNWVAFFAQGQLRKAEVAGGAPIRLAEAAFPFGGTWNDDNTIIYASSLGSGLLRVPARGGTPESLTKPDGAASGYSHGFPQALPGGRNILFKIWGQTQGGAVLSLDSGRWEMVLPGPMWGAPMFDATGGATGRLLVIDESAGIKAAPFDPAHPARTSADTSVLANVYYDLENDVRGWLCIANNRTAVYAPGNPAKRSLVWVDRDGKIELMGKDQDLYRDASLSPDGAKAVVRHNLDLWIHDLRRGTRSPLTSGNGTNLRPLWSRDGTRIIFASNRGGDWDIYSQPADGSRPAEALLKRPYDQVPNSILADGTLLYDEIHPKTGLDLWTLSPDGKTSPVRVTPFNETDGQFSPDPKGGPRWIAYASDESGRSEIYMQSYPGGANRILVSPGGGILPRWSRDGKELFYVTGDAIVAVAIRPDGSFGASHRLFDRSNYFLRYHSYDVSTDGKRFLMIQRDPGSVPRQLNVILDWSDDLDRLVPDGRRNERRQ
jgi:Tol biopolymer transport system component/tRNA A-37 threonylcarbamoyl transferase component Bud32